MDGQVGLSARGRPDDDGEAGGARTRSEFRNDEEKDVGDGACVARGFGPSPEDAAPLTALARMAGLLGRGSSARREVDGRGGFERTRFRGDVFGAEEKTPPARAKSVVVSRRDIGMAVRARGTRWPAAVMVVPWQRDRRSALFLRGRAASESGWPGSCGSTRDSPGVKMAARGREDGSEPYGVKCSCCNGLRAS